MERRTSRPSVGRGRPTLHKRRSESGRQCAVVCLEAALFLSSEAVAGSSHRQSLFSLAQSDFASREIIDSGLYLQFAAFDCVADHC
jgi:hypothetical protein